MDEYTIKLSAILDMDPKKQIDKINRSLKRYKVPVSIQTMVDGAQKGILKEINIPSKKERKDIRRGSRFRTELPEPGGMAGFFKRMDKGGDAKKGGLAGLLSVSSKSLLKLGAVVLVLKGLFDISLKAFRSLVKASPLLQAVLEILGVGFMLILMPLGNYIAKLLLPLAMFVLKTGAILAKQEFVPPSIGSPFRGGADAYPETLTRTHYEPTFMQWLKGEEGKPIPGAAGASTKTEVTINVNATNDEELSRKIAEEVEMVLKDTSGRNSTSSGG